MSNKTKLRLSVFAIILAIIPNYSFAAPPRTISQPLNRNSANQTATAIKSQVNLCYSNNNPIPNSQAFFQKDVDNAILNETSIKFYGVDKNYFCLGEDININFLNVKKTLFSAINISSSTIIFDLNNHKINNTGSGDYFNSLLYVIEGTNRMQVRNGRIDNFPVITTFLAGENNSISNIIFSNNQAAAEISGSGVIENNQVVNGGNGFICSFGRNCLIRNNSISLSSNPKLIRSTTLGGHSIGIELRISQNSIVENNTITLNNQRSPSDLQGGILTHFSSNSTIRGNTIRNIYNGFGINTDSCEVGDTCITQNSAYSLNNSVTNNNLYAGEEFCSRNYSQFSGTAIRFRNALQLSANNNLISGPLSKGIEIIINGSQTGDVLNNNLYNIRFPFTFPQNNQLNFGSQTIETSCLT